MSLFKLSRLAFREITLKASSRRVAEPELIMDTYANVETFARYGQKDSPLFMSYIYYCAHISEVIRPGDTVFDLGCGPGNLLGMVAKLHPETNFIGVDLSSSMLNLAQQHVESLNLKNVELLTGDITKLHFAKDFSADAVISTLSFHHLPTFEHFEAAFAEASRILKPHGGIFISDYGHLKHEDSINYFARQHSNLQSEILTTDYLNSLRAAFFPESFHKVVKKYLMGQAKVYTSRPLPIIINVKSPRRNPIPPTVSRALSVYKSSLSPSLLHELHLLTSITALGGLFTKWR